MADCRIAPSILSVSFARLDEEVTGVIRTGTDLIHFDMMDNHYVLNLIFGPVVCAALKPYVTVPAGVHLMVEPVDNLTHVFIRAGTNITTFYPETGHYVGRSLGLIKEYDRQAGLVLNPATPVGILENVLDRLSMVLLMPVSPGFGGQNFIPSTLVKIRKVRRMLDKYEWQSGRHIASEVDGGVETDSTAETAMVSANTFMTDSTIFNKPGYKAVIDGMRQQLAQIGQLSWDILSFETLG